MEFKEDLIKDLEEIAKKCKKKLSKKGITEKDFLKIVARSRRR